MFDPFSLGDKYAMLPLDLSAIASPSKYRVLFYSEVLYKHYHNGTSQLSDMTIDFTSWADIPPNSYHIVTPRAQTGEYAIPVIANLTEDATYPSRFLKLNYTNLPLSTLGYRLASANLSINVLEPLSPTEVFKNFWDTFGDPISLIGGGFAAGFSALVFNRMIKKRKEQKGQQTLD